MYSGVGEEGTEKTFSGSDVMVTVNPEEVVVYKEGVGVGAGRMVFCDGAGD